MSKTHGVESLCPIGVCAVKEKIAITKKCDSGRSRHSTTVKKTEMQLVVISIGFMTFHPSSIMREKQPLSGTSGKTMNIILGNMVYLGDLIVKK